MVIGLVTLIVVVIIGILLVIGTGIGIYNSIISFRNRVDNSWHQIDILLRKRYDLIPNLVETVRGYTTHEKKTLENIVAARSMGIDAGNINEQAKAENILTDTLKSLFAVMERYPTLKADMHFSKLMEQLNGIEANIAYARQFYNDIVMKFNTRIQIFPGNMFAKLFNFTSKYYFEIEKEEVKEQIKVEF